MSTRKQAVAAKKATGATSRPNIPAAFVRLHVSFLGLLGGFLGFAEVNPTFGQMRDYASTHDVVLPACYAFWWFLYGIYRVARWKVSADLEEVRMENRRKGHRQ